MHDKVDGHCKSSRAFFSARTMHNIGPDDVGWIGIKADHLALEVTSVAGRGLKVLVHGPDEQVYGQIIIF